MGLSPDERMDEKKLKNWRKVFREPNEDQKTLQRIKEIDVLLSELSTLKPAAQVFRGTEKSVLFVADLTQTKADLKKERNSLKKKSDISSDVLAF